MFSFVLSGVGIAYIWGWELSPNFYTCVLFGHLDSFFSPHFEHLTLYLFGNRVRQANRTFPSLDFYMSVMHEFQVKECEKKIRNQFFISLNKALLRLNK